MHLADALNLASYAVLGYTGRWLDFRVFQAPGATPVMRYCLDASYTARLELVTSATTDRATLHVAVLYDGGVVQEWAIETRAPKER